MTLATLIHRETCLKSFSVQQLIERIVKKGHFQQENKTYKLTLNAQHLILKRIPLNHEPKSAVDEGFESDIDSISLQSLESVASKNRETDSANGSSDSDLDQPRCLPCTSNVPSLEQETFNLVNCVCYTDLKCPHVLIFNVKSSKNCVVETCLIFRFDNIEELSAFHANFSTVKAVANQKRYANHVSDKSPIAINFNLLQRTDVNGITHIRISNASKFVTNDDVQEPLTSIISLQTPEPLQKSKSSEDLLNDKDKNVLRKVWNSAENLLEEATKHKTKKRVKKGPAPQPPTNVLQGPYVRVKVEPAISASVIPKHNRSYEAFKFSDPKNLNGYFNGSRSLPRPYLRPYTEVHPRVVLQNVVSHIKTQESKSFLSSYAPKFKANPKPNRPSFSERLFGMSAKLKDLSLFHQSGGDSPNYNSTPRRYFDRNSFDEGRRFYTSLGNLNLQSCNNDGTLKSVIKKTKRNDDLKPKEKKVTFSAYNTVQVV